MAEDGSIQSCIVCFNFLHQQWLHFVKSRTAINKRLYWLKRPAGCEIRQIFILKKELSESQKETLFNYRESNFKLFLRKYLQNIGLLLFPNSW